MYSCDEYDDAGTRGRGDAGTRGRGNGNFKCAARISTLRGTPYTEEGGNFENDRYKIIKGT